MEARIPDLTRLRNDEHNQLMDWINQAIVGVGAEKLNIVQLHEEFVAYLSLESSANKDANKSGLTVKINDRDSYRDKIFKGLWDTINTASNHFNPVIAAAAAELKIDTDRYGNLAVKPLAEETSGINNLLKDLNAKMEHAEKIPGVVEYMTELAKANKALDLLMVEREKEKVGKVPAKLKRIREEVDGILIKMVKAVNVFSFLSPSAEIESFIALYNRFVERTEYIVSKRVGKKSGAKKPAESQDENDNTDIVPEIPDTPKEPVVPEYPDAKEWTTETRISDSQTGEIFYVTTDGKKEYYKLLDRYNVSKTPGSAGTENIWEKVV